MRTTSNCRSVPTFPAQWLPPTIRPKSGLPIFAVMRFTERRFARFDFPDGLEKRFSTGIVKIPNKSCPSLQEVQDVQLTLLVCEAERCSADRQQSIATKHEEGALPVAQQASTRTCPCS